MEIQALETVIVSGSESFPVYVGFVTAEDLLKIAEVPNFKDSTPDFEIATNVLTPPVKQWQRPLMPKKRDDITATFNGTGEFMPNPVLVAERCVGAPPGIEVVPLMAAGAIQTPIRTIKIPDTASAGQMPLWIIDGQHRINGLGAAGCKQKGNPVPVVLLLNSGFTVYNGRNLAKIFAQVTTEATPLDALHKEWLTFAFHLGPYQPNSAPHKAMECVAELCKRPVNKLTNKANGFHDDIRFNDKHVGAPKFLGSQQYDCKDLSALVAQHYYDETSSLGYLAPGELADQIALAFDVLRKNVQAPHDQTVFFGNKKHHHKIMCDAYLVGVLTYLRAQNMNPTEPDWDALLKKLNFHQTDWNFQQHVISQSRWVDKSKQLAIAVFASVFGEAALPTNVANIWDFLSGDQLYIEMEFRHINDNGNAVKKNHHTAKFGRGDKKTVPMNHRKYFRIINCSVNAKHLSIVDEKSSPSAPVTFRAGGEYLRAPKVSPTNPNQDPLTLTIKCILYGGIEERITINLAGWK